MKKTMKMSVLIEFVLVASCLLSPAEVLILQTGLTNVFSAGATYSGVKDTSVVSAGGANVNYGGRTTGFIGADNATILNRALICFDLTSLAGQNVVVTSAVLKLRASTVVTATVDVYRVSAANADWTEGDKGGTLASAGESTWGYRHYTATNWAGSAGLSTAGTDYFSTPISTAVTDGAWEEFVFTDLSFINDWINGSNGGLVLKSADREASGMGKITFYTHEGTASNSPILELGYTVVPKPKVGLYIFSCLLPFPW